MVATIGRNYRSTDDEVLYSEGGSTVHQTWCSAAAILALPNLQLSAILLLNGDKCRVKKRVGSTHQSSDENEHAYMDILTLKRLLEGKNPSKVGE